MQKSSGDNSEGTARRRSSCFSPMMRPFDRNEFRVGLFILTVGTGQPAWQGSRKNEWLALDEWT